MTDASLLKENLMKFFSDKRKMLIVRDVITQKKKYSLRVVEWFINNYSKKYNVKYKVGNKVFDVYASYKNEQMKSYSKKYFDLFRRTDKFTIEIDDCAFETTTAQLNFFKWAIENKVLVYVEKNLEAIRKDMSSYPRDKKIKVFDNVFIDKNKVIITFD
jgi:hypothetical protein